MTRVAGVLGVIAVVLATAGSAAAENKPPKLQFWVPFGGTATVNAITSSTAATYVGGDFDYFGPLTGHFSFIDPAPDPTFGFVRPVRIGVNGLVRTIVSDRRGGFFIGGDFTMVNGHPASHLAHIDRQGRWDPRWQGSTDGTVRTMVFKTDPGILYIGGHFDTVQGGATRHNLFSVNPGQGQLQPFDPNVDDTVDALAIDKAGHVIAGGEFGDVNGGTTRHYLAAFNAVTGMALSWDPDADDFVNALAADEGGIYAGGDFDTIGGASRASLAHFQGTGDSSADGWDPDTDGSVQTLALAPGVIYVGGSFAQVNHGAVNRTGAAAFPPAGTGDGALPWDPDPNDVVRAIAPFDGDVLIGGDFTILGSTPRDYIGRVTPDTGEATGWDPNPRAPVYAIGPGARGALSVGGQFDSIGGLDVHNLVAVRPATGGIFNYWLPQLDGEVKTLEYHNGVVYVGGDFTQAGSPGGPMTGRNYGAGFLARNADLTGWNPDVDANILSLDATETTIYAGGEFTHANGGTARQHAAGFDLDTGALTGWDPQVDGTVNALAANGDSVYLGGGFSNLGADARQNVAAADPITGAAQNWNPGANGIVRAFYLTKTVLYAGGDFGVANGMTRHHAAAFTFAGGVTAFDPDIDGPVWAIGLCVKNKICAGGDFDNAGGQPRMNFASLSPATGALDPKFFPDPDGKVNAIQWQSPYTFVGGEFTHATGKDTPGLAVWK